MDHLSRFHALYEAFNRRDIDAVRAMMCDEVDWPNAWKGGRLTGREAVRHYWTAQWAEIHPRVEPLSVSELAAVGWAAVEEILSVQGRGRPNDYR